MKADFYKKNRQEFFDLMPAGSLAIFYSGVELTRSGDDLFPFAVNNNFYYLTGIRKPDVLLAMAKDRKGETKEIIFIDKPDHEKEKWLGPQLDKTEAIHYSDIVNIEYYEQSEMWLRANRYAKVFLEKEVPEYHLKALNKKIECLGFLTSLDSTPLLRQLRNIKKPEEIEAIKSAIDMTADGLKMVRENIKPGMKEFEIQALFEYVIASKGSEGVAFETIVASGRHGTTLHYSSNNDILPENAAVLLDCGAKYLGYSADISRTYPTSGCFDQKHEAVYSAVLDAQEQIIPLYKNGVSMSTVQLKSKDILFQSMLKHHLCESSADIANYFYHGVGHPLGLDTHDLGRQNELVLRPGMVITCEPGLYLSECGIGVRIEDDILITKNGPEVLSLGIPKKLDEICK